MCPLTLFGILFLLFIIFYTVKSVVILVAGAILIGIVLKMTDREKFSAGQRTGQQVSTDPIDTGIENPGVSIS